MSINSFENLSNEFFCEIFDYLNCWDIYQAFSNLNYRFQQLLNSSPTLFKIQIEYSSEKEATNDFKQLCLFNKNQIYSIYIRTWICNTEIILSLNFDSFYQHLQCLVLSYMELDTINVVLPRLMSLPCLYSLTIETESDLKDFGQIYRSIFNLSKLKYFKLKAMDGIEHDIDISLPIATDQQLTSIQRLTLDHPCLFNQLNNILSYTSQISHLKIFSANDNRINVNNISSIRLPNLIHLSIEAYYMEFNTFEMLIKNLNIKLKTFSLKIYADDMNYLNAARWEKVISKHLSDLEEFYLKYITSFGDGYQPLMYQGKKNEFFSSFWCQRQWLLEIEIDSEEITYYIHPYKKRWYEFSTQEKNVYTVEQLAKSKQLILSNIYQEAFHQTLTILDYLEHILPVMQIDHLDIQQQIFIVKLGEILNLLPDLDSLKLGTISISYPRSVTEEELFGSYYLISQNKVTKLCLERIDRFEEIYFIISLCPRIQKLRINSLKKMNIELFVRSFFTEIQRREIRTLKSLCFCVPIADDKMMKKLETMIKNENLLLDFTMKRMMNQIYIQWK